MKTRSVLTILAAISFATPGDAQVTMETCEADYAAMLAEAEANRINSIAQIEYALARTADDETAMKLQMELDLTWETEEEYRNLAAQAYRDCVAYVKASGS